MQIGKLRRRNFMLRVPLLSSMVFLLIFLCIPAARGAESKGSVESAEPGFWALRDGNRMDLQEGSDIYEFDILQTDANGSAIVRFADDSVLEIRSDTQIDVKEVVFSESRNRFNVGVVEGSARVITGAIVRQNPRGFKMTTPKSTIGIRGTILLVEVRGGEESILVEAMDPAHIVLVRNNETHETTSITGPGGQVSIDTNNRTSLSGPTFQGERVDGTAGTQGSGTGGFSSSDDGGGDGGHSSGGGAGGNSSDCGNDNSSPPR